MHVADRAAILHRAAIEPEFQFAVETGPSLEQLARLFGITGELPNIAPNWNTAPTQASAVVRRHPDTRERRIDLLRWGLVPHYIKDLKAAARPINARAETVATSGMFRGAFASRRCIVPADAFYEWKAMPDGKRPYAIARTDGASPAFAGLWEGWKSPEGETLRTFAIITTAADAAMSAQSPHRLKNVQVAEPCGNWCAVDCCHC